MSNDLIKKLDAFASTLNDNERELLGELLVSSLDVSQTKGKAVGGIKTSALGAAVEKAQAGGKTKLRLHLEKSPDGVVLAAAGPVAGKMG